MKSALIRIGACLGGFIVAIIVVGFFSIPASTGKPNSEPLVVISHTGGKCVDSNSGEGNVCFSEETIYSDGSYDGHDDLSTEQVEKLKVLIQESNLDALSVSTGADCPSAYDGTDIAYSYPAKYASTVYTLCQIASSEADPLLAYTSTLIKS